MTNELPQDDSMHVGDWRWTVIDHVQLAIPPGGEPAARSFYVGRLGLEEVPKPAAMAARGGAWFQRGDVRVHVGVEDPFVPARKAHPALSVVGLHRLVERRGLDVRWSDEIPGVVRCHVFDPFGNRIELIEAGDSEPGVISTGATGR
jgi:catechol 2,3-dioxygenase-like lactoylglutathione lyase family enzyme